MDGMHRAMGIGGAVFFDGRECIVRPRGIEFEGLVEAEIVRGQGDPFELIIKAAQRLSGEDGKLDPAKIAALADAVFQTARQQRNVTWQEHVEFLNTPRGEATEFWFCLRENFDSTWTIDRVQWVLQESHRQAARISAEAVNKWWDWKHSIRRAIDIAGGEDLLGNLTGLRGMLPTPVQPRGPSSAPSVTDPTGQELEASAKSGE